MSAGAGNQDLLDLPLKSLSGEALDRELLRDRVVLVVNVASKCGFTPQYEGLERLQERFANSGFTVLGAPCDQFAGQEPGSAAEIEEFCSATYGVSFPLLEKLEVNGSGRHPLYNGLVRFADGDGVAGDVEWNFEKFLVGPRGPVRRFRSPVEPESDQLLAAIEAALSPPASDVEAGWESVAPAAVEVGDRVRPAPGFELTVTRVQPGMLGNPDFIAFIEDSDERWVKVPARSDGEVEVLRRAGSASR